MIRLFIGLAIPEDICARWVALENFHITLRFVGEVIKSEAQACSTQDHRISN
jgi:2'-5' RNA ligase